MPTPPQRPNLTARAARWSAAHWKTATFAWLAFVAVAALLGIAAGTRELTDVEDAAGETAKAVGILEAGFKPTASESVFVHSDTATVHDPEFRRTVARVVTRLRSLPQTQKVHSPFRSGDDRNVSADGHSALVTFELRGDSQTAADRVEPVLRAVAGLQRASPGYTVSQFGDASAEHEIDRTSGKDFRRAELLSVPITFLILLLAFGAFVAAGIPVLLAFSAVLASIGLNALLSHLVHSSGATTSVILLIGMAVGVDYSLFYLKREREEVARGNHEDALVRAAATSGRAVLVSGATVLVAMGGMLFAGVAVFTSIAIGAMFVVACTMVGSLTVLPALLGKLGNRVDRGVLAVVGAGLARACRLLRLRVAWPARLRERRTFLQRLKGERQTSRLWDAVLRPVLRFPKTAALSATALLLVCAVPALSMHTKLLSFTDLPKGLAIVETYKQIERAFPGTATPAVVAVRARDVRSPDVQAALADLRRRARAAGVAAGAIHTDVNPAHTVAAVQIPLHGHGDDRTAVKELGVLRHQVVPAALGGRRGLEYAVTGETAGSEDFNSTLRRHFPLVFAFVLGVAFLLLLVTFRSIVIPIKAIVLNLLSVAAAYGILVWIFQQGRLESVLGFSSNGGVIAWLPLFLFVVLFALSMDYHVFIVSRIKELVDEGVPNDEAVAQGIRTTASTVTSAALVMVAVFAIFAGLSSLDVKQLGVGLAVAVLIDATIIRGVLLPASMKLLGRWNWYLPQPLHRLPRWGVEPRPEPVPQTD